MSASWEQLLTLIALVWGTLTLICVLLLIFTDL